MDAQTVSTIAGGTIVAVATGLYKFHQVMRYKKSTRNNNFEEDIRENERSIMKEKQCGVHAGMKKTQDYLCDTSIEIKENLSSIKTQLQNGDRRMASIEDSIEVVRIKTHDIEMKALERSGELKADIIEKIMSTKEAIVSELKIAIKNGNK
jgi:hypothetical protein